MTGDELYNHYASRALRVTAGLMSGFVLLLSIILLLGWGTFAFGSDGKQYKKVVAVGGSVTEIIYALGEEGRLIARDSTSLYPTEATKLPDVGYIRRLSPEGVLSVEPDLVLALEGSGPPEAVAALQAADVPVIMIPEGYSAEKIEEKINATALALGVPEKASSLIEKIRSELQSTSQSTMSVKDKRKVLFVLTLQGGKIMASGTATAADGIIRLAGAENAINGFEGYKPLSDESVITAAPDVILMMTGQRGHANSDAEILSHPAIATTPAGRNGNIIRMDGLLLLGFGPRTAQAIGELQSELRLVETQ
ncbi:MAG: ABC transporter substrate-binding protein [Pseudomonadota bacterium]